ncbi:MAG TPA: hypothetical protein VF210_05220 [Pseudomonadales bacterium]
MNDWRGREQIVQGLKQEWQRDDFLCTGRWTKMMVIDNVAVGWGDDACQPRKGGALTDTQWLSVHRRQSDGQWREEQSLWNLPNSPPSAEMDIPSWAHVHLAGIHDAYNSRNAEAIAARYVPTGRINDWIGHQGIIDGYKQLWSTTDDVCTGRWIALKLGGGMGVGWGEDVCRPKTDPAGEVTKYPWLSVVERQADGRWLEVLTVWSVEGEAVAAQ